MYPFRFLQSRLTRTSPTAGARASAIDTATTSLKDITDGGYSEEATNPYAIEDDDEMSNRKFAFDLTKNIPRPATLDSIRYASLSNGHTNHAVCCALDEVECDIPELSEDGHMPKAKIVGRCPTIEAPPRNGLTWKCSGQRRRNCTLIS